MLRFYYEALFTHMEIKNMKALFFTLLLGAAPALAAQPLKTLWVTDGFEQPESAIYDPQRERIYVSNINGQPNEKNGHGYISVLDANGQRLERQWLGGLNAPKGMAIVGDHLLVTDIDRLLVVDLDTAEIIRQLAPGASFLNDIAADNNGNAYISDMLGNTIYQYRDGELVLWLHSADLQHPNGLTLDGNRLIVASWGGPIAEDFRTDVAGSLLALDLQSKTLSELEGGEQLGNLDGVVRIGRALWVNDWMTGALYRISDSGKRKSVAKYAPGLADIGSAGKTLLLPFMFDGEVRAVRAR